MRSRPPRCYRCGAKRGLEGEGYFTRCVDRAECDIRYDKQRQRSSQRSGVLVVFEAPNPPAELAEGICSWCSGELRNPDGAPLRGRARCWKDREGRDCQGDFNRSRQWKARDALRALARHEGRTALACVDCGQVVEEWGPTGSVDRETGEPRGWAGWRPPRTASACASAPAGGGRREPQGGRLDARRGVLRRRDVAPRRPAARRRSSDTTETEVGRMTYEQPSHIRGAGDYTNAVSADEPAIHATTRERARNALGDMARKIGIRLHAAAVTRLTNAALEAAFNAEAEEGGTICETCCRVTVEPVVDSNEGFAFCGQCAVDLIGAERDLLRSTLAGLLPFARGNQPVLDRIHAALDDTTEPRTKTREEG